MDYIKEKLYQQLEDWNYCKPKFAEDRKISTHSQKCEAGADFYINSNFF